MSDSTATRIPLGIMSGHVAGVVRLELSGYPCFCPEMLCRKLERGDSAGGGGFRVIIGVSDL